MKVDEIAEEFVGERLLQAVSEQQLVANDLELAAALIDAGDKVPSAASTVIYRLGETTRGIYFILHGGVALSRHGTPIAQLWARTQLGSWPVLCSDPTYDVTARTLVDTVLLRVEAREFRAICDRFPVVWKRLARAEADRLRASNELFLPTHSVPRLLIGSASKSLPEARRLAGLLAKPGKLDVVLWTDAFPAGGTTIESLTSGLDDWDFAVFFLTPDDELHCGDGKVPAPRDNIVFEAGLCMGRFGRRRTLLLRPKEPGDLKLPSDLEGLTLLHYVEDPAEVLDKVLSRVEALGSRTRVPIDSVS